MWTAVSNSQYKIIVVIDSMSQTLKQQTLLADPFHLQYKNIVVIDICIKQN